MKKINLLNASMALAVLFSFSSCNKNGDKGIPLASQSKTVTEEMISEKGANPDETSVTENSENSTTGLNIATREGKNSHYLFTESNSAEKNVIQIYEVNHDGSLSLAGATTSGGTGAGKPLGSQGALVLDKDHEWLYAVNAGSNSVSSFKVYNDGRLMLAHTAGTHGTKPVSVSVYGNMLYVLNAGSDNIHGFRIGAAGALTDIAGSTKSLSGTGVDAPQISFTPNGDWVVVTEKATNILSTFRVNHDGSVGPGIFTASVGKTPFGFEFSRGRFMIVSNAAGGSAGAGSATSYIAGNDGKPKDINGAIPNLQAAPCWVAITKYGRFAYITNTASNSVSSYYVAPWGGLYLAKSIAAKTDMGPLDVVVAANNYYVYVLNAKSNTIGGYHREHMGGLEPIGNTPGLPAPATGLAIY